MLKRISDGKIEEASSIARYDRASFRNVAQAQLEADEEKIKELIQRVEEVAQQAPSLSLGDMINSVFWERLRREQGLEEK